MFPVFAANPIDAYILYAAFFIWIVPELLRSRQRGDVRGAGRVDRFSGPLLLACIWIGITVAYNLAFLAPQAAIPWQRGLVFGIGIF